MACDTRSSSTTGRCRAVERRVPPDRRLSASDWLRRDDDRRRRRLRRAVSERHRGAQIRRRGRPARRVDASPRPAARSPARRSWDGTATYSFNADGRRIPAESVAAFAFPGRSRRASSNSPPRGSSTFDNPRYDVRFRINELSVGKEPVGLVTGTLALRGRRSTARSTSRRRGWRSPATGRIALNEAGRSES